ncbi:UNVERIFIED_CONTAM: hypothetical protein RMT77_016225 [Armadillidium vulgare]
MKCTISLRWLLLTILVIVISSQIEGLKEAEFPEHSRKDVNVLTPFVSTSPKSSFFETFFPERSRTTNAPRNVHPPRTQHGLSFQRHLVTNPYSLLDGSSIPFIPQVEVLQIPRETFLKSQNVHDLLQKSNDKLTPQPKLVANTHSSGERNVETFTFRSQTEFPPLTTTNLFPLAPQLTHPAQIIYQRVPVIIEIIDKTIDSKNQRQHASFDIDNDKEIKIIKDSSKNIILDELQTGSTAAQFVEADLQNNDFLTEPLNDGQTILPTNQNNFAVHSLKDEKNLLLNEPQVSKPLQKKLIPVPIDVDVKLEHEGKIVPDILQPEINPIEKSKFQDDDNFLKQKNSVVESIIPQSFNNNNNNNNNQLSETTENTPHTKTFRANVLPTPPFPPFESFTPLPIEEIIDGNIDPWELQTYGGFGSKLVIGKPVVVKGEQRDSSSKGKSIDDGSKFSPNRADTNVKNNSPLSVLSKSSQKNAHFKEDFDINEKNKHLKIQSTTEFVPVSNQNFIHKTTNDLPNTQLLVNDAKESNEEFVKKVGLETQDTEKINTLDEKLIEILESIDDLDIIENSTISTSNKGKHIQSFTGNRDDSNIGIISEKEKLELIAREILAAKTIDELLLQIDETLSELKANRKLDGEKELFKNQNKNDDEHKFDEKQTLKITNVESENENKKTNILIHDDNQSQIFEKEKELILTEQALRQKKDNNIKIHSDDQLRLDLPVQKISSAISNEKIIPTDGQKVENLLSSKETGNKSEISVQIINSIEQSNSVGNQKNNETHTTTPVPETSILSVSTNVLSDSSDILAENQLSKSISSKDLVSGNKNTSVLINNETVTKTDHININETKSVPIKSGEIPEKTNQFIQNALPLIKIIHGANEDSHKLKDSRVNKQQKLENFQIFESNDKINFKTKNNLGNILVLNDKDLSNIAKNEPDAKIKILFSSINIPISSETKKEKETEVQSNSKHKILQESKDIMEKHSTRSIERVKLTNLADNTDGTFQDHIQLQENNFSGKPLISENLPQISEKLSDQEEGSERMLFKDKKERTIKKHEQPDTLTKVNNETIKIALESPVESSLVENERLLENLKNEGKHITDENENLQKNHLGVSEVENLQKNNFFTVTSSENTETSEGLTFIQEHELLDTHNINNFDTKLKIMKENVNTQKTLMDVTNNTHNIDKIQKLSTESPNDPVLQSISPLEVNTSDFSVIENFDSASIKNQELLVALSTTKQNLDTDDQEIIHSQTNDELLGNKKETETFSSETEKKQAHITINTTPADISDMKEKAGEALEIKYPIENKTESKDGFTTQNPQIISEENETTSSNNDEEITDNKEIKHIPKFDESPLKIENIPLSPLNNASENLSSELKIALTNKLKNTSVDSESDSQTNIHSNLQEESNQNKIEDNELKIKLRNITVGDVNQVLGNQTNSFQLLKLEDIIVAGKEALSALHMSTHDSSEQLPEKNSQGLSELQFQTTQGSVLSRSQLLVENNKTLSEGNQILPLQNTSKIGNITLDIKSQPDPEKNSLDFQFPLEPTQERVQNLVSQPQAENNASKTELSFSDKSEKSVSVEEQIQTEDSLFPSTQKSQTNMENILIDSHSQPTTQVPLDEMRETKREKDLLHPSHKVENKESDHDLSDGSSQAGEAILRDSEALKLDKHLQTEQQTEVKGHQISSDIRPIIQDLILLEDLHHPKNEVEVGTIFSEQELNQDSLTQQFEEQHTLLDSKSRKELNKPLQSEQRQHLIDEHKTSSNSQTTTNEDLILLDEDKNALPQLHHKAEQQNLLNKETNQDTFNQKAQEKHEISINPKSKNELDKPSLNQKNQTEQKNSQVKESKSFSNVRNTTQEDLALFDKHEAEDEKFLTDYQSNQELFIQRPQVEHKISVDSESHNEPSKFSMNLQIQTEQNQDHHEEHKIALDSLIITAEDYDLLSNQTHSDLKSQKELDQQNQTTQKQSQEHHIQSDSKTTSREDLAIVNKHEEDKSDSASKVEQSPHERKHDSFDQQSQIEQKNTLDSVSQNELDKLLLDRQIQQGKHQIDEHKTISDSNTETKDDLLLLDNSKTEAESQNESDKILIHKQTQPVQSQSQEQQKISSHSHTINEEKQDETELSQGSNQQTDQISVSLIPESQIDKQVLLKPQLQRETFSHSQTISADNNDLPDKQNETEFSQEPNHQTDHISVSLIPESQTDKQVLLKPQLHKEEDINSSSSKPHMLDQMSLNKEIEDETSLDSLDKKTQIQEENMLLPSMDPVKNDTDSIDPPQIKQQPQTEKELISFDLEPEIISPKVNETTIKQPQLPLNTSSLVSNKTSELLNHNGKGNMSVSLEHKEILGEELHRNVNEISPIVNKTTDLQIQKENHTISEQFKTVSDDDVELSKDIIVNLLINKVNELKENTNTTVLKNSSESNIDDNTLPIKVENDSVSTTEIYQDFIKTIPTSDLEDSLTTEKIIENLIEMTVHTLQKPLPSNNNKTPDAENLRNLGNENIEVSPIKNDTNEVVTEKFQEFLSEIPHEKKMEIALFILNEALNRSKLQNIEDTHGKQSSILTTNEIFNSTISLNENFEKDEENISIIENLKNINAKLINNTRINDIQKSKETDVNSRLNLFTELESNDEDVYKQNNTDQVISNRSITIGENEAETQFDNFDLLEGRELFDIILDDQNIPTTTIKILSNDFIGLSEPTTEIYTSAETTSDIFQEIDEEENSKSMNFSINDKSENHTMDAISDANDNESEKNIDINELNNKTEENESNLRIFTENTLTITPSTESIDYPDNNTDHSDLLTITTEETKTKEEITKAKNETTKFGNDFLTKLLTNKHLENENASAENDVNKAKTSKEGKNKKDGNILTTADNKTNEKESSSESVTFDRNQSKNKVQKSLPHFKTNLESRTFIIPKPVPVKTLKIESEKDAQITINEESEKELETAINEQKMLNNNKHQKSNPPSVLESENTQIQKPDKFLEILEHKNDKKLQTNEIFIPRSIDSNKPNTHVEVTVVSAQKSVSVSTSAKRPRVKFVKRKRFKDQKTSQRKDIGESEPFKGNSSENPRFSKRIHSEGARLIIDKLMKEHNLKSIPDPRERAIIIKRLLNQIKKKRKEKANRGEGKSFTSKTIEMNQVKEEEKISKSNMVDRLLSNFNSSKNRDNINIQSEQIQKTEANFSEQNLTIEEKKREAIRHFIDNLKEVMRNTIQNKTASPTKFERDLSSVLPKVNEVLKEMTRGKYRDVSTASLGFNVPLKSQANEKIPLTVLRNIKNALEFIERELNETIPENRNLKNVHKIDTIKDKIERNSFITRFQTNHEKSSQLPNVSVLNQDETMTINKNKNQTFQHSNYSNFNSTDNSIFVSKSLNRRKPIVTPEKMIVREIFTNNDERKKNSSSRISPSLLDQLIKEPSVHNSPSSTQIQYPRELQNENQSNAPKIHNTMQ